MPAAGVFSERMMGNLEDYTGERFELAGRSREMIIAKKYRSMLAQNGFVDFESFFDMTGAEVIKRVREDRATFRRQLVNGKSLYIKQSLYNPFKTWLKATLKLHREKPSALHELENLIAFREAGLPVAEPVAAGFRKMGRFRQSFVATLPIPAETRLSDFVRDNWQGKLTGDALKRKRKLIRKLADLARRMHLAGFNHRDFYLVHFMLDEETDNLFILDLNRADRRDNPVERWVVKDLAALDYSAPGGAVFETDRIRFLKYYLGSKSLTDRDKNFARKIRRKAIRLGNHAKKADERDRRFVDEKGGALP